MKLCISALDCSILIVTSKLKQLFSNLKGNFLDFIHIFFSVFVDEGQVSHLGN